MPQALTVLIVEDNANDAELLVHELRRAGFEPDWRLVQAEPEYLEHLHSGLDLVLSDYGMPQFCALRALDLLQQSRLDVPFIVVSGSIGEDIAVAAIKQGAMDYLLKDRLARLGPAVNHALALSRLRRERKQADEALRASEERLREFAENIHEVFWMTDHTKNQVLYISPAYERIWGRTCASLYARPHEWREAIHPSDRERILQAAAKQAKGEYDETYRIVRPDGTERWIHDKASPVAGPNGTVIRIVGVAEDITDRRALEEQLRRKQRTEAVGALANGIAHDLNNILAPVLVAPALLRETVKSEPEVRLLELIEQSAQRGSAIVRQLLTFSRGAGGERVVVQVRHLLEETIGFMRETFPRNIELVDCIPGDLWPVLGDPNQLQQVIMNLCVNARDAMPNGGRLTLIAKNGELRDADVQAHRPAKAGSCVAFTVADTGQGIPVAIIDRIFDPFFTTKVLGKGAGLGLSTVQGVVTSHEGFITVASEPGRGATFTVHLPASRDRAVVAAPEPDGMPCGNDELILVVDDEPMIRETLCFLLQKHGYRVLTAIHGQDALEVFHANRDVVGLVLTDLMMPVMDGLSLIRTLRLTDPDLKVIATSGMIDREKHAVLKSAGVTTILRKPATPRELLEAIAVELAPSG
ncbi:MAG TPA: response regulator [Opitutaceae bacterium]|nr:response regulator [Opitutaceae bacterium]